ncbi:hypothetical protein BURPS406E_K0443 [Burkholderia pseudomallei 406e]|nr:hypothetical protein BURPS406E_K0443 [Burkholderia pseudomallei 406e]
MAHPPTGGPRPDPCPARRRGFPAAGCNRYTGEPRLRGGRATPARAARAAARRPAHESCSAQSHRDCGRSHGERPVFRAKARSCMKRIIE